MDKRIAQREGRAGPVIYLYHDHQGSTVASSQRRSSGCASLLIAAVPSARDLTFPPRCL